MNPARTPAERYQVDLQEDGFLPDPVQALVVDHTQRLYEALTNTPTRHRSLLARLQALIPRPRPMVAPRGLYLWGGVGRGKTHLINAFHDALPFSNKLRIHFHRFMQHVHHELGMLRDRRDPLRLVAAQIARQWRVICLDEFLVSDITDAMLLAGLLDALFEHGVVLVTTSNIAPDDLYRDGLQRTRFLPAIALINKHMESVHLEGQADYRLRALERAEIFHTPQDKGAEKVLNRIYESLGPENMSIGEDLMLDGRPVATLRLADGIAWFSFATLCEGPRSTADYIEIARCYHTVFISGIPIIERGENDIVARFIHLVDEFYDRNVNLVISAATGPAGIYPEGRLQAQFQRTRSRLEEMQSHDYLARTHLP